MTEEGKLEYFFKGRRPGFSILPTDDITHCDDGYTEVRRMGEVVGVYKTALIYRTPKETPDD